MACACEYCKISHKVKRVIGGRNRRHMRELIEELFDRMIHAESDVNYNEAILDGSWPNAVEILEHSLEEAKKIQAGPGL